MIGGARSLLDASGGVAGLARCLWWSRRARATSTVVSPSPGDVSGDVAGPERYLWWCRRARAISPEASSDSGDASGPYLDRNACGGAARRLNEFFR